MDQKSGQGTTHLPSFGACFVRPCDAHPGALAVTGASRRSAASLQLWVSALSCKQASKKKAEEGWRSCGGWQAQDSIAERGADLHPRALAPPMAEVRATRAEFAEESSATACVVLPTYNPPGMRGSDPQLP
ncbi:hypothetical protein BOTBODRAFT_490733 [Botryobasidium botryosum FD-172 SS1]|uniref:Uncharacterized protein n=1 Tax=Botryobasidium botryosum (strain FD-172 SS1) TaxID=930990 RepID=A0A067MFE1_BOTB1|nr:hypothetical protein BOTBODRAFT_490733 [Botryobasidium botryosum FD-172 SS1]